MFGPARYFYHEARDISAALLSDQHASVAIRPGDILHTKLIVQTYETGEEMDMVDVEFDAEELDMVIAELQRARSGCFIGQWPRPFVPKPSANDYDYSPGSEVVVYDGEPHVHTITMEREIPQAIDTVQGLVQWLEETFSYSDRVGNIDLIITPA